MALRDFFRRTVNRVRRRLARIIAPEPPAEPTIPTAPPPPPPPPVGAIDLSRPNAGARSVYVGFPFEMGDMESGWWLQVARRYPPRVRDALLTDATAMHLYHRAFFGFRGDEFGNNRLDRSDMPAARREFYAYMRNKYNIDFQTAGFPWADWRAQYGRESDRVPV